MVTAHVEYLGFTATSLAREYRLRIHQGSEVHDFMVAVPNEAFLSHRLKYQDGPEVCFLKLQRALAEGEGRLPESELAVTESDLVAYRVAHTPQKKRRGRA
jgi:hypothetical protein